MKDRERATWHRNTHLWLPRYIKGRIKKRIDRKNKGDILHVMFCVADHFEPFVGSANRDRALERVLRWAEGLPKLSDRHLDSDGRRYRHTFFYPIEDYDELLIERVADLCRGGHGEVEFHLHHDQDTEEHLRRVLLSCKKLFVERHGLLSRDRVSGEIRYGFIHGNWALDNSRPDRRWCGINNEIEILRDTGCFADFTMPSAPSMTQTSKINSIYYAIDDPGSPKSHNTGPDAEAGKDPAGDLLMIQGPLGLSWRNRKKRFLPSIENGELGGGRAPDLGRFLSWMDQGVHVKGRKDWIFIKVHTHGALERNAEMILGPPMGAFLTELEAFVRNEGRMLLHYVTAREMYNIIRAAEAGLNGDPGEYRDYELLPSAARSTWLQETMKRAF